MARPTIAPYSEHWPSAFQTIAKRIRAALGPAALRIDHIGSTAVPGLPAKNTIDVQVTVADLAAADRLAASGLRAIDVVRDHRPPGARGPEGDWAKRLFMEPDGERRANIHVREEGRANQRYALLCRDYLRAHPDARDAYAELKRGLAAHLPDVGTYADVKDPVCDLIAIAAEDWAAATAWSPPPSDA